MGWRNPDDEPVKEAEQPSGPMDADRFLSGLRQKMERGEITTEEYQLRRAEIIVRI